jgi:hypothetical protein
MDKAESLDLQDRKSDQWLSKHSHLGFLACWERKGGHRTHKDLEERSAKTPNKRNDKY